MARQGGRSSQDLWTEGEALERAGKAKEALDFYVKAALAEEDAGRALRARLLWEQIAQRVGSTGTVLERLAGASEQGKLKDDALCYWTAACARYRAEGRPSDAERARSHALGLKQQGAKAAEVPALARPALESDRALASELIGTF